MYGIEPHLLNDDRLGRALDAIAPRLDEVIGSVGAAAISEFGVDVARLHGDMTSISLYGATRMRTRSTRHRGGGIPRTAGRI